MKNVNVKKASIVLNLQKQIIGIKLIDLKEEFESINLEKPLKNGPLCFHFREAMEGHIYKISDENITCEYAKYALGIQKPDSTILEGRSYKYCGLYESNTIAREIVESMKYLNQNIYGLIVGPLELMEDADLVVFVDCAETIMRTMQGYAYKYGTPKNLNFFGNQASCADLVSKPYSNNDINLTLMCRGMRANGRFDKGELGVAIPINLFDSLLEGIVATANPVLNPKEKQRILDQSADYDFEIEFDMSYNYGKGLREYDQKVKDMRIKDRNHE